jgi:hypothetical protein
VFTGKIADLLSYLESMLAETGKAAPHLAVSARNPMVNVGHQVPI